MKAAVFQSRGGGRSGGAWSPHRPRFAVGLPLLKLLDNRTHKTYFPA